MNARTSGAHCPYTVPGTVPIIGKSEIFIERINEEVSWFYVPNARHLYKVGQELTIYPVNASAVINNFDHTYLSRDNKLQKVTVEAGKILITYQSALCGHKRIVI